MLDVNPFMIITVNLDLDILHDVNFMKCFISYIESFTIPEFQFGIEVTENCKYSADQNLNSDRSKEIVESIIKLGKSLKFKVIAEFVETVEQKQLLESMGCYLYQGYLYYKAMPLDRLMDILLSK